MPFWGCPDFIDADMPPLTKGMEVFLRFTYAPIPKLFKDLQSDVILRIAIDIYIKHRKSHFEIQCQTG
jgi:hypothetical protein